MMKHELNPDLDVPQLADLDKKHKRRAHVAAGFAGVLPVSVAVASSAEAANTPTAKVAHVAGQPSALPDNLKGINISTLSHEAQKHLGSWNSHIKRYEIDMDTTPAAEVTKDQNTVKFYHVWDGAILLHRPAQKNRLDVRITPSPSAYNDNAQMGNFGNVSYYNGRPHKKGEFDQNRTDDILCIKPLIAWGTNNNARYGGLISLSPNGQVGGVGYLDLDLAEQAGAIDYYVGGSKANATLIHQYKPFTGKVIPYEAGDQWGECFELYDLKSSSSQKQIDRYIHKWYDLKRVSRLPKVPR